MIAGVLGGVAEYAGWDPTLLRLIYVIGSILLGAGLLGVLIYLIAWMIVPERRAF
jgi:phage shock protein PspC (stress-responsive transcriptional regulator)